MPPAPGCVTPARPGRAGNFLLAAILLGQTFATAPRFTAPAFAAQSPRPESDSGDAFVPIAGAFVYPVGDELDYTRARPGESNGYYVSDPYLARRGSQGQRVHKGIDLSNGSGGAPVHAIASGVVVVADRNALVKTTKKVKFKTTRTVKGKKVVKTGWRYKTSWKWRTGWGNYVVIKHTLPSGESVYSLYGHLAPKSVGVTAGEIVSAGQVVGKVGKTGRASSPHLHLEIRKNAPDPDENDRAESDAEEATAEDRTFALLATVDPVDFLDKHVRKFEDLEPGSWEARYALAACRDGLAAPDEKRFDPDGSMDREEFYRSLVLAFRLSTAFPSGDWSSTVSSLVEAGVLDAEAARAQKPDDKVAQSEALGILLRCLDRHRARARSLASVDPMQLCLDFNRHFAGAEAAEAAAKKAKAAAWKETEARRMAEADRVAKARKAARASGKKSRVKARPVQPATPTPILDPGCEALAQSKKNLTRAEGCLLLASALSPSTERLSALQRAAGRVAQSG